MSHTVQETKHLTLKQCLKLKESNYYAESSQTEYCQFAIEARIVELQEKAAEKYAKSTRAVVDQFNSISSNILPPALPKPKIQAKETKRKLLTFSFSGPLWAIEDRCSYRENFLVNY